MQGLHVEDPEGRAGLLLKVFRENTETDLLETKEIMKSEDHRNIAYNE